MGSLLLEGGIVVPVDADRTILDPGYVLVEDGTIRAVGGDSPQQKADRVLDVSGCIVVPGFVNTHQHHWYNLFKGLGEGMLLEQWISDLLVPTAQTLTSEDLGVASRLSCLEMIRSGTTTSINHMVSSTSEPHVDAILEAVVDMGMRQPFAKEVRAWDLDDQLAQAEGLHRRWNGKGDGRVRIGFAIESSAHWVALKTSSAELIQRGDELAARLDTMITDHVAGGTMSRDQGYLKFVLEMGRTDIEYLHSLGVLGPRWLLAHAIHVRDHDIELIADAGSSVSHTPTAESSRGGGITPVRRMLQAGVNVGLGTDGPMVDTSVDMVEQMKTVRLIQNQLHLDPMAVDPWTSLEMATIRAARAIGWDDHIESLQPGKRADLAVFDLDTPWSTVNYGPVSALVHSRPRARCGACAGGRRTRDRGPSLCGSLCRRDHPHPGGRQGTGTRRRRPGRNRDGVDRSTMTVFSRPRADNRLREGRSAGSRREVVTDGA